VRLRVALSLVVWEQPLLMVRRNVVPVSERRTTGIVKLEFVPSGTGCPLRHHWYEYGPVPVTPTVNVTVHPSGTSADCGWLVIESVLQSAAPVTDQQKKRSPPVTAITTFLRSDAIRARICIAATQISVTRSYSSSRTKPERNPLSRVRSSDLFGLAANHPNQFRSNETRHNVRRVISTRRIDAPVLPKKSRRDYSY
jgi:hypothetical protein